MLHLEHYQTSGPSSNEKLKHKPRRAISGRVGAEASGRSVCGEAGALAQASLPSPPMLVNRLISQRSTVQSILLYPSSVKVLREKYPFAKSDNPPPVRSGIEGFSDSSRRRLRFLAGNTSSALISQFCLTYHRTCPDGATVKKHLNSWLTRLRSRFPEVAYLWVLEFQTRGVPHFHVWLNLPADLPGLRNILAKSWNRIAEPENEIHLKFHNHKSNFIPWEMYNPSYACKYLDKQSQKSVPAGFVGCGRFWGNSRGLLATPSEIFPSDLEYLTTDEIDLQTGEISAVSPFTRIIRTLGKLHERKLSNSPWRSRVRTGMTSCTLQTGAVQFRQMLAHFQKMYLDESDLPF